MSNEELEKISQRVAEIVVEKIRLMQAEFDDEYRESLDRIRDRDEMHDLIGFQEAEQYLLEELKAALDAAIAREDYLEANKIAKQIKAIEKG